MRFRLGVLIALWMTQGAVGTGSAFPSPLALAAAAVSVPGYPDLVGIPFIPFPLGDRDGRPGRPRGPPVGVLHPLLVHLGEWSFVFYLTHQQVIRTVGYVLVPTTAVTGKGAPLLAVAGSIAGACLPALLGRRAATGELGCAVAPCQSAPLRGRR
ncbi:hypothetical protein [Blastococcus saxobsidens]|uniref:Uncharacterized protein n=1 Tax=Blastococcus saxobsidens (strain DD2) TaxID=1146883 RepID=H6RMZ9_BLASD|nr:hypothetical protein [Blastococcus saxobsidens]CCG01352.1 exported protein of unknown function [Blastococcus saxobsidens DD2]